jgi:hypothetical protein
MKITNKELLSKINILQTISQRKLPVKVSYAIAKNIASINKELKIFEAEKLKIINEYALKDEKGQPITEGINFKFEDDEKKQKCNEKYSELLNIETDIEFRTINTNELFKSDVDFSPAELIELDFMIIE